MESKQKQQKEAWLVVDNDFNRCWNKDLIGKTFVTPPSYCGVKKILTPIDSKEIPFRSGLRLVIVEN